MNYNIKFQLFCDYVHLYYVEGLHDKILEEMDVGRLEEYYYTNRDEMWKRDTANYPLALRECEFIVDVCEDITRKYYYVDEMWKKTSMMAYFQTNEETQNIWHNHIHDSSITATVYINPTLEGEGGELLFWHPKDGEVKIQPQKDVIFFFPSWLMHKPLPQTREEPRICLNWAYDSSTRPIHKLSGDRW